MKQFRFSLEKLLRYKEQLLDVERGVLAEMNARLAQLQRELEQLQNAFHGGSRDLNRKYAEGITPVEIIRHKTYLHDLAEGIIQRQREIELQQQAIDRQIGRVREAKIEISTIEKLKEKKLEEYSYLAAKAEEQVIEEFVSNQKAMANRQQLQ